MKPSQQSLHHAVDARAFREPADAYAEPYADVLASASGKAIIVGEHAVVYGARAVAMPVVSMRMGVRLHRLADLPSRAPEFRILLGGRSVSDHLAGVVAEAFVALDVKPFSLALEGTSTVLVGAGLGSSASLCIVVLRAIAEAAGKTLGPAALCELGNRLERRFHGNPSGLDTAVVALEQVISFVKGTPPHPVAVARVDTPKGPMPWRFALLDSGARSSTLAMIQAAAPYFQAVAGPARIARFDALATAAIRGLGRGDAYEVSAAMNEAGALLHEAGVVGEALDGLIDAARNAGALAAKSTGAGGGGCVLALLDPAGADAQLETLRQKVGVARVYEVSL